MVLLHFTQLVTLYAQIIWEAVGIEENVCVDGGFVDGGSVDGWVVDGVNVDGITVVGIEQFAIKLFPFSILSR